jgi:predicted molibdopterin-dependent oxidoreductase YjgC
MSQPVVAAEVMPLLNRVAETDRDRVVFTLDGRALAALEGDTVLTALLTNVVHLRHTELSGAPRAGFCLMGACQDCWVGTEGGERVRACSTLIENGMRLVTDRSAPR